MNTCTLHKGKPNNTILWGSLVKYVGLVHPANIFHFLQFKEKKHRI